MPVFSPEYACLYLSVLLRVASDDWDLSVCLGSSRFQFPQDLFIKGKYFLEL